MYIANQGRAAFLEFLRNLTPQVMILAMAFLIARRLDFNRFDLHYIGPSLLFFAFVFIWLFAIYANSTLFIENVLKNFDGIKIKYEQLKSTDTKKSGFVWELLKHSFKHEKLFFCEVFVTLIIVEVCVSTTFIMAMVSFSASIKALH